MINTRGGGDLCNSDLEKKKTFMNIVYDIKQSMCFHIGLGEGKEKHV